MFLTIVLNANITNLQTNGNNHSVKISTVTSFTYKQCQWRSCYRPHSSFAVALGL